VAVQEALEGYLKRSGLAKRLEQTAVIPEWPELVGAPIAAVTEPERVTPDGTLFVSVAGSAWMNELQLMTPQILTAINRRRAAGPVTSIRWVLKTPTR
jgi:predicted nucleic acid-binding Zn ribbon protein